MTVNESKSYLPYLNKLLGQYNNTYHHSIIKKLINADYSALIQKIETKPKAPSKGYSNNYSGKYFLSILF